ncbi:MAG: diguanylate cyclase domain-containing protein [Anaeroplasmataceae bacterium]
MQNINVICLLILSIILLVVFVRQSIVDKVILKFRLALSFLLTFILIVILLFNKQLMEIQFIKSSYDYIIIGLYVGIVLIISLKIFSNLSSLERNFIGILENNKYYFILDKNEKIKDVSNTLCNDLNISKEDIVGKKLYALPNNVMSIVSINGVDASSEQVREYLKKNIPSVNTQDGFKKEFVIKNKFGDEFILNFTDYFIFSSNKYKGHLLIGDVKSSDSLLNAEYELNKRNSELEEMKIRYTSHLEITEEAVFFYDIEQNFIWGNDSYVETLDIVSNTISRDVFKSKIYREDLAYYDDVISKLNPNNPTYDIQYRFLHSNSYPFVREVGKLDFDASGRPKEIVGFVELVKSKHFERSNMDVLDKIKDIDQLISEVEELVINNSSVYLVSFRLNNLPEINNEYGRSIGNIVLSDYIKSIIKNYVDDNLIYRVGGIEFVFMITDSRKIDHFRKNLINKNLTNFTINHSSLQITCDTYFGICTSGDFKKTTDIIRGSYKALNHSLIPNIGRNYFEYKDIV